MSRIENKNQGIYEVTDRPTLRSQWRQLGWLDRVWIIGWGGMIVVVLVAAVILAIIS